MQRLPRLIFLALLLVVFGCQSKPPSLGSYSIGRDQTWFPLLLSSKQPNLNAFTNALVQEIAKSTKLPMQIVDFSWSQLIYALEQEQVAGVLTSLSPDVITQDRFSFSTPFLYLGPVLVVPEASKAESVADLNGAIIGVYQYDQSVFVASRYPSLLIQMYQSIPLALASLAAGELDALLVPNLEAQNLVPSLYPNELKIVTEPLTTEGLRLITLKNKNKNLLEAFNKGLRSLEDKSCYEELRTRFRLD